MAVSDSDISAFVAANIGNPQAIADAAKQYGVSNEDISRATGYSSEQVGSYLANAGSGALPDTSTTVDKLYTDILGRQGDTGGLDYWKNQFGDTVDANELATFKAAAAPELSVKRAWDEAQASNDYSKIKDTVAKSGLSGYDISNAYNLTPEQRADITAKSGYDFTSPTITDYQGTVYDTKTLMNLANQLGQNLDPSQLSGGVYGENRANIGFDPNEYERATGMKANSVSQVLLDAARGLVQQGVTDLSQLKQGDIKSTVNVRAATDENGLPTGKYVASWADQYGDTQSRELTPEEAARISRTTVDAGGDSGSYEAMTLADAVTGKGLYYGDKLLSNDPTFLSAGQTYSGPGYTSYGVVYDEQGKPHFRTTGGSSSDLAWAQPIITLGSVIPNPYQPYFQAANAAIAYDQGNTKGALLNAGLSYAGFQDASAADSALSGIDLGNATNTASITAAQNAANARLAVGAVSAYDAAQKGNYAPLLTLGANVSGSPEVTTALNTMSAANAVANKDLAGAFTAAGNLTKSPDLVLAGSATRFINAVNSGDQNAIIVAGAAFGQAADANAKQGGAAKTVFDALNGGAKAVDTSGLTQGSAITPEGSGTKATTPTTDTEFGNLDKAIEDQKNIIAKAPSFADAYDAARSAYGPGKTFEWNGKTYSTDTRQENASLAAASDASRLNAIPTSTTAGGGRGSAASYANYDAAAAALGAANVNPNKGATQAEIDAYFGDGTAQYDPMGNVTMGSLGLADDKTALGRLVIDSNKAVGTAVQTGLSNLAQAGGEQIASLGGAAATIGLAGADNAAVKAGQSAENFGKSIETESSKQGAQNIYNAVKDADGVGGKIIAGLKAGFENPGAAVNMVTREALQEVLPVGAAKATAKMLGLFAAAGVDTALNAAESMGGSYNEVYQAAKRAGATDEQADQAATRVGLAAGAVTLVTSGVADAAVVKSIMREANSSVGSLAAKTTLKEGVSENVEETATALATQYLTTGKIDWNAATTQGVIGQLVGGKTAGAITAGEGALESTPVTNIESVSKSVAADITGGKDVGSTIDSTISASIKGGESGPSVVSSAVSSAISSGADVTATVDTAIGSAITNKVDAGAAIDTAVGAAISSGADATTSITAAINSAANSGVDIHTSIDSSVAAAVKAGVDTQTAIDAAVNAATNAGVNTNVATNIATNAATNTNVNTNANVNTNTNVNTDTSLTSGTGTGTPPSTEVTPPTTAGKTTTPTTKKSLFGGAGGGGGAGTFLPPEPTRFHKIGEDFKPLNPTLFALAGINPLEGTLEEAISKKEHQPKNTMPTLADLMFAPSSNPVAGPTTQQSAGLMPLPIAQDSGDGTASQPQTAAPAEPPDMVIPAYAQGGLTGLHPAGQPQFYSQGGLGNMHVQGDGDGTSDSVPAMVAKDEFVLPADVVSSLGNGSSEAGASVLDHFVEIIRQHKHSNKPSELPPESKGPLEYLASAMKKGHM